MFNFISFYRQFKDQMKPVTSMPTLTVPAEPEVKAVIQPRLIDGLTQVQRVLLSMSDGKWRTLEEISDLTGDTTPSVSARLRDLRKPGSLVLILSIAVRFTRVCTNIE